MVQRRRHLRLILSVSLLVTIQTGLRAQAPSSSGSPAPIVPGDPKSSQFSTYTIMAVKTNPDPASAIAYLTEAARMQEAAGTGAAIRIPILLELERLYSRAKDLSGQETTIRNILSTWIAAVGPDQLVVANNTERLASVLSAARKTSEAAESWNRALTIVRENLGPNHSATEYALAQFIRVEKKAQESDPGATAKLQQLTADLNAVRIARSTGRTAVSAENSGKVERVGKGVTSPSIITMQDPEYSEQASKSHVQGTVMLSLVVDRDGVPTHVEVLRPLGMGLDEAAVAAVTSWVFKPGVKDGQPVPVRAQVEVDFRLL